MKALAVVGLIVTAALWSGCGGGEPERADVPAQADGAEGAPGSADSRSHADSADHAAHSPGASADDTDGHAHHGAGDPRPLLPIMQQLGTDMVTLTHALMTDSAALVSEAAGAIADHPPIAADDLDRIQKTLGAEMPEFERLDEAVHEASVRLHEAAEGGDTGEVLTLLNEVQRGCVACHDQFRERLRTNTQQ